jgi:hypothetical protein
MKSFLVIIAISALSLATSFESLAQQSGTVGTPATNTDRNTKGTIQRSDGTQPRDPEGMRNATPSRTFDGNPGTINDNALPPAPNLTDDVKRDINGAMPTNSNSTNEDKPINPVTVPPEKQ